MYSDQELNSAVSAGAISQEAAEALRTHVAGLHARPIADEENFRLINSFSDIFVAIGVIIMLIAMGAIGQQLAQMIVPIPSWSEFIEQQGSLENIDFKAYADQQQMVGGIKMCLAGLLIAATSWGLAEFFTLKRRMALPSIILLLSFLGGVFASLVGPIIAFSELDEQARLVAVLLSLAGVGTVIAAWLHWRRFAVPITIAGGVAALATTVIALILAAIGPDNLDNGEGVLMVLFFVSGLAIFAFAMRWDISDTARVTRRSDVAFWLHLLAAPMIAHPLFYWIGVTSGDDIGVGSAVMVVATYIGLGLIALAVDRRALLVSALVYVLVALAYLFDQFGAVELNIALTALVIGSALLSLSAYWTPIRRVILHRLPANLQAKLPALQPQSA